MEILSIVREGRELYQFRFSESSPAFLVCDLICSAEEIF